MKHDSSQLPTLIDLLRKLDLEVTAEEVAEILWLAARLPPVVARTGDKPDKGRSSGRNPNTNADGAKAEGESSDDPNTSTGALYPTQAQSVSGEQRTRSIRSPAAYALPGTLEIARHLRPLKRRVPSRTQTVFDEAATVHHIAATSEWLPIFNPAAERWLDVILLVDESSSMVIWQRMVSELKDLLERQGAFRTVSLWGFRCRPDATAVILYSGIGPTANRNRPHRAAELHDPLGRRLVLVVSDCVAPVWHNGVMATLLAGWGRAGLVALLQVLPDRLWVRSGLRTFPAIYLRSPMSGAPNAEYPFEWTTHRLPERPPHSVPVPVASLDALPLGYWAQALAGSSNLWVPGVLAIPNPVDLETGVAIIPPLPPQRTTTLTAEQLLRNFYGSASPTARRLANFLAAAPLTLPIMRLVQRAVVPEARVAHLAEVFLSGLIERPSQPDDSKAADSMEYFFVEGVRDRLLNNLRLTETIDVLDLVSRYVGEHLAQPLDFGALITDPKTGDLTIGAEYQSFAQISAQALRRFGGDYVDLADWLEVSVDSKNATTTEGNTHPMAEVSHTSPNANNNPSTAIDTDEGFIIKGVVKSVVDVIGADHIDIAVQQTVSMPPIGLPPSDLHLLNFGRLLTEHQQNQIEQALSFRISRIIQVQAEFDEEYEFGPQIVSLVDRIGFTTHEWQTTPILVNPPGFAPAAVCLLSELHGRLGHFPAVIRLRPVRQETISTYSVAEIINLQVLRDAANRRSQS